MSRELRVLLVTGAYYPQISSSGIQCRAVARVLAGRVRFHVLATATDPALAACELVDGVEVRRVLVDPERPSLRALVRFLVQYVRAAAGTDLVHVHGVSRKNELVAACAALTRTPLVVTLHTAGEDEPQAIDRRGWIARWSFRRAARIVSVSTHLTARYRTSGLPQDRLVEISNGVDVDRFRPADIAERQSLKQELGFPRDRPLILFVGFFSHDKRPDVLFDAWAQVVGRYPSTLAFVGATGPTYREIDPEIVGTLRDRAARAGLSEHVHFVGQTHDVDRYYRAADCYVLPSRRDAMSLALLEAMACGLPSIATRLAGVTEGVITDEINGVLVDVHDTGGFATALAHVLGDREWARRIGAAGRQTVGERYTIDGVARQWVQLYESVLA
jgi:glycosyltransferase involved in cell wall biosynthesis